MRKLVGQKKKIMEDMIYQVFCNKESKLLSCIIDTVYWTCEIK